MAEYSMDLGHLKSSWDVPKVRANVETVRTLLYSTKGSLYESMILATSGLIK
jgi:hypothetical protein